MRSSRKKWGRKLPWRVSFRPGQRVCASATALKWRLLGPDVVGTVVDCGSVTVAVLIDGKSDVIRYDPDLWVPVVDGQPPLAARI
jgi:hypothetical protein